MGTTPDTTTHAAEVHRLRSRARLVSPGLAAQLREQADRLDDALAVVRAISKRIAVAAERGDTAAVERFCCQREISMAEVERHRRVVGGQR